MIRAAEVADRMRIASMRALLWPDSSAEEHLRELEAESVGTSKEHAQDGRIEAARVSDSVSRHEGALGALPRETFVAADEHGTLMGFVEVGLRSHADGCDPTKPVGFLEGWFVNEAFRRRGIGGALVLAAENWARGQGCVEMASDTWIDHEESQKAHVSLGFEVVDRCVHFRKQL